MATLIYTSGTTGEPKGVMLTHANMISNVIDAGEKYSFSEKDVPLSVLPLSHVFERGGMYLYIFNGMAVYYAESIDKVPDNLREVRPTIFVGVPRIFEKVYAKAKLKSRRNRVRLKEKIFDWAIEVGKEFRAANARKTIDFAFSRRSNTPLPTRSFSQNSASFSAADCASASRAARHFPRHLFDFHRRGRFDYAGLRLDRNFARDFVEQSDRCPSRQRSANRFATSKFASLRTAKSKFQDRT